MQSLRQKGGSLFLIACCLSLILSTSIASADAPTLQGLDQNKPMILPITVQAAYNTDTMFFNIQWTGDRGDTHDLVRYTNGAWQKEGAPRREGQSTIDNDPARGPTNVNSTNYESRVTWMVNGLPGSDNHVPEFSNYGCFCTCHDDSRAMPEWDPSVKMHKYLNDDAAPGDPKLDLWHHRIARSNPIGASDDQNITKSNGSTGGRNGDSGSSPYQTNKIVGGNPSWLLDATTTSTGKNAVPFADIHESPDHSFRDPSAPNPSGTVPQSIDYADAVNNQGYTPTDGDTVPRRRLRQPTGSRGDISAAGTTLTPTAHPDEWDIESSTQRLLDTGNPDDVALVPGSVYDVGFAVHTGMVTVRDHYVSFPLSLSLGGGPGDVLAAQIPGAGSEQLPDWSQIAAAEIDLFLPGIASFEFLNNDNLGKVYIDPQTNAPVDQSHAGAGGLAFGMSCQDCHSESGAGLSMENVVPLRGGVWTPTPLIPEPGTMALLACFACVFGLALKLRRKRQ